MFIPFIYWDLKFDLWNLKFLIKMEYFLFILFLSLIFYKILKFSKIYMSYLSFEFLFFMLLFYFSMMFLIVSNSWIMLFLGWEGLGITSYILILFWKNWNSVSGSYLTMMSNRLGDSVLLMSFYLLMFKIKSIQFFFLMLMLLMTKSCQFPFSSWLPAAMAAPTPVSALVHSSTLVTAGIFVVYLFDFPFLSLMFLKFFTIIFTFTMVMGSWSAMMELDIKKLVAFSTLSQLGLISMSYLSLLNGLFLIHLISHALFKSSMFLVMGMLISSLQSSQNLINYSSFFMFNYMILMLILLSLINMMGLIFTSGFFSKENLILMLNLKYFFLMFMIFFSLIFTMFYSFRILKIYLFIHSNFLTLMLLFNKMFLLFKILMLYISIWWWLDNFFYLNYDNILNMLMNLILMSILIKIKFINMFKIISNLNKNFSNSVSFFFFDLTLDKNILIYLTMKYFNSKLFIFMLLYLMIS